MGREFDIGSDIGTGVGDCDYQVPFAFAGKIVKLNIKIDRPKLSAADLKLIETEGQQPLAQVVQGRSGERHGYCIDVDANRCRCT